MKKSIYIGLLLVFMACADKPIDNYAGGIIHKKHQAGDIFSFTIQVPIDTLKSDFKIVYVTDYDFGRYSVGDTIK